jgi:hypothetical protein
MLQFIIQTEIKNRLGCILSWSCGPLAGAWATWRLKESPLAVRLAGGRG